jgi:hypothetical protein
VVAQRTRKVYFPVTPGPGRPGRPAGVRFPTPSPVATVPLVDVPPFVLSLAYRTDERSPAVAAFLHNVHTFHGAAWVHVHAPA